MAKRREVTPSEKAAANKLKALFNTKKKQLGLTQESAAEKIDMTQSALSQYLGGDIPINIEALFRICDLIGENPYKVHPELLDGIGIAGSFANSDFKNEIRDLTDEEVEEMISYAQFLKTKRS